MQWSGPLIRPVPGGHSCLVRRPGCPQPGIPTDAGQTGVAHVGQVVADRTPNSACTNAGVTRLTL
jgi:hypothetical protein